SQQLLHLLRAPAAHRASCELARRSRHRATEGSRLGADGRGGRKPAGVPLARHDARTGVEQRIRVRAAARTSDAVRHSHRTSRPVRDIPQTRRDVARVPQWCSVVARIAYDGLHITRKCIRPMYSPRMPSMKSWTPEKMLSAD